MIQQSYSWAYIWRKLYFKKMNALLCSLFVVLIAKLCPTLLGPHGLVVCQAPQSTGFPRQEYWSGLPSSFLHRTNATSPALAGRFFASETPGKPYVHSSPIYNSQDMGFPCGSAGKESSCNVGDLGLIPGSGRSPGEGKGYPLQYSGLENSMHCTVRGVSELDTTERLSLFKTWKQPEWPSAGEWIKMWYTDTMDYCSVIKRRKIGSLVDMWMDQEIIILSEVRQRKTSTIWYHLHVESNIRHKWTYLCSGNGPKDRTDLWLPREKAGGRGKGRGWG